MNLRLEPLRLALYPFTDPPPPRKSRRSRLYRHEKSRQLFAVEFSGRSHARTQIQSKGLDRPDRFANVLGL
jgi:hypothetical protein